MDSNQSTYTGVLIESDFRINGKEQGYFRMSQTVIC